MKPHQSDNIYNISVYIYIQATFLPSFQIVSDITFTLFLSLSDFFVLDPLAFSVVALCTLKYKCINIQLQMYYNLKYNCLGKGCILCIVILGKIIGIKFY